MLDNLSRYQPYALGVLRIMTALLFIEHGTQKLIGFPPSMEGGAGVLDGMTLVTAILEAFGGFLILIGFLTRPVAFILSGFMAVAYFMAHAPQNFFPVNNMGDAAILYCFIYLYLFVAGPGAWSVDSARRGVSESGVA
jgi:putative oxidoreductase